MDTPAGAAAASPLCVTTMPFPPPRSARRVAACERLTPEHAVQRQRVQDEPIVVAWKVERRANGQELISISSDESSGDDSDSDFGAGSAAGASATERRGKSPQHSHLHNAIRDDRSSDEDEQITSTTHRRVRLAAAKAARSESTSEPTGRRTRAGDSSAPSRKRARNTIILLDDDDESSSSRSDSDDDDGDSAHGAATALIGMASGAMRSKPPAPVIYSIDSDSDARSERACDAMSAYDEEEEAQPSGLPAAAAGGAVAGKRQSPEHCSERDASSCAFEYACDDADNGDTTPETTGSSCGDADVRVKSELEQLTAAKTEPFARSTPLPLSVKSEPVAVTKAPVVGAEPAGAPGLSHNAELSTAPIKCELSAATRVIPRKVIPLMRRKKLDEEDAAFLLFHGISETPTAHILGLIIEYIDRCVGTPSAFLSRAIKFLLWRKMNAHVNAALETERLARSEWMKIVFSSEDASMRQAIYRTPLLPRPVRITVRPLQFVYKTAGGTVNAAGTGKHEAKTSARKQNAGATDKSRVRLESTGKAKAAGPPNGRVNGAAHPHCSQDGTPLASLNAAPRSHKRKAEHIGVSAVPASPMSVLSPLSSEPYTPRKHRRRHGSVTMFDGELPVRGHATRTSPKTIEMMKPLALNQFVTGRSQSLPVGRDFDFDGYRTKPCIQVSPLPNMSTAELESHINSVRSEGRVKSFEKLSDVLAKLMSDARNYRGMFNTPVDPVALNLPTYTSIIKNPMDLGTVKTRLTEGRYMEIQDFANDVRLVFENAKLFNAPGHSVHQCADLLLKRFEAELKSGLERKRNSNGPKHACSACYGHTCVLCDQQCLPFAQPHMQCSGACGADIRKGSIYYITRDGTRVWCHKCRNRLVREKHAGADASLHSSVVSVSGSETPSCNGASSDVCDSMVRMKCDTGVEPWVKCCECARWVHQVCGLFNPVAGEYAAEHEYVCPLCRWREKTTAPPPTSSLHNLLNPTASLRDGSEASKSTCLNIPPCELSRFIQDFLIRELQALGQSEAAATLNVRVLSFPGETMAIPESVVRAFDENANALAQARPERDVTPQRLPPQVSYLSRGIYLFQKHDGVEVSLFTLYAQEFGDDCELAANRRAVYIAYIDSIRYLAPASARTSAYHLIMLAYFDYIRRHGFDRVHIWSCPPQKRISYVFWCRPAFQKTPSAEHLRSWYNQLLSKAKARDIVQGWTTLYDRYLSHEDASDALVKDEAPHLIATRGVTARSVDPSELAWPVSELPPIFDGDFIPAELERIIGRLGARNGKVRRASSSDSVKNAAIGSSGGKRAVGDVVARIKDEPSVVDSAPATAPQHVEFKLREIFAKCQSAVKRMKQDLLVVHLAVDTSSAPGGVLACRPERTVPAWCQRVPRFFGSRFMFHQLCSYAGYQFDSLRRAKHSTMMILHHYFNEHLTQVNIFCRDCSLLITHAAYWACLECDRYALCDTCYQRDGHEHAHALQFGQQLTVRHAPYESQTAPSPQQSPPPLSSPNVQAPQHYVQQQQQQQQRQPALERSPLRHDVDARRHLEP